MYGPTSLTRSFSRQPTVRVGTSDPKRYRTVVQAKRKRTKKYSIPATVSMGKQSFPLRLKNTLKYMSCPNLTLAAASGYTHKICVNGMFDPDLTLVGHQPQYFDQLMTIYNHYTVLAARIKWSIAFPSTAYTGALVMSICCDDDSTFGSNPQFAAEQPGAVCALVPYVNCPGILTRSWSAAKTFGPNPESNDDLQGDSSSNPTEISVWMLSLWDPNLAAGTVNSIIEIEYDCIFEELKQVAQS